MKIRALLDERGQPLEIVKPGEPCEIMGANAVPESGDRFYVVESEREAREIASKRRNLQRQQRLVGPKQVIDLDNLADAWCSVVDAMLESVLTGPSGARAVPDIDTN